VAIHCHRLVIYVVKSISQTTHWCSPCVRSYPSPTSREKSGNENGKENCFFPCHACCMIDRSAVLIFRRIFQVGLRLNCICSLFATVNATTQISFRMTAVECNTRLKNCCVCCETEKFSWLLGRSFNYCHRSMLSKSAIKIRLCLNWVGPRVSTIEVRHRLIYRRNTS
jgi:hypothetical protein